MVDCEVWIKSDGISFNAAFAILPRIGEEVLVKPDDDAASMFIVKRVVHVDLAVHGKEAKPSVQLWVESVGKS